VPAAVVPVALQVLHRPPEAAEEQAVLQQTPSVQNPLWHSSALVHAAPFTFRPQELFAQMSGRLQSVSSVQMVLQAPESHTKLPQEILAGVAQAPLPSQFEAGVSAEIEAQTAGLQPSPAAKWSHSPPLQDPVVPQFACGVSAH
jgi:hypothetical protein